MPDISMCKNKDCKFKKECYRFMAKPSDYQSYASFKCKDKEAEDSYFMEIFAIRESQITENNDTRRKDN